MGLEHALAEEELRSRWAEVSTGDGRHLNPSVPQEDLGHLLAATDELRTWVNKHVAHLDRDRGEFEFELTFGQLDDGYQLVYDTYRKYFQLITLKSLAELRLPKWNQIFEVAWSPP